VAPELLIDSKLSLFRPWRDTRFSENKAPLKTNIAAGFPNRTLGKGHGAGVYLEVAATWVWIGGGVYSPDSSELHAIREHIAGNQRRFERLLNARAFKKLGGLKGETLTRMPRGWPKDHPAGKYLVHKQFLGFREEPAEFAAQADFYKQLLGTIAALTPLVSFLNEPLLEQLRVDKRSHLFTD
jgi:uncharacterized protein (TIGR02453 family)